MAPTELDNWVKKRGMLKASLTRFRSFIDNLDDQNCPQLTSRIEKCKDLYDKFDLVQTEIEMLDPSDKQAKERVDFEENYYIVMAIAEREALGKQNPVSDMGHNSSSNDRRVKLPAMEIPSFSGSYRDWAEFRDAFISLIHNNDNILNIQKFYYLKKALTRDAIEAIRALDVSENNYQEAWSVLNHRYENKKKLANSHIENLFNLPMLTKESFSQLRKFLDTVITDLRSLKALGPEADSRDILLIHLLENKLDSKTRIKWRDSIITNSFPKLKEFLDFLDERCQKLENDDSGIFQESRLLGKSKFVQRSHVTGTPRCSLCNEPHFLYDCYKFKIFSLGEKRNQVKQDNACWNCLRPGHAVESCTLGGCRFCGRKHNSLLHQNSADNQIDFRNFRDQTNRNNKEQRNFQGIYNNQGKYAQILRGFEGHRDSNPSNLGQCNKDIKGNKGFEGRRDFIQADQGHSYLGGYTRELNRSSVNISDNKEGTNDVASGHASNNYNNKGKSHFRKSVNQCQIYQGFEDPDDTEEQSTSYNLIKTEQNAKEQSYFSSTYSQKEILLSTAIASIADSKGKFYECRILLDSGSQCNFITEELVERLQLPIKRVNIPIVGVGQGSTTVTKSVKVKIHSKVSKFAFQETYYVINKISGNLPSINIEKHSLELPTNIILADSKFYHSRKIDLLLGASLFWDLICTGQLRLGLNKPILQKTKLGWIISGPVLANIQRNSLQSCNISTIGGLQRQIAQFWEIKEFQNKNHISRDEEYCENLFLFQSTTVRDKDGRFVVNLPLRGNVEYLGSSYEMALNRFLKLEKRLEKREDIRKAYNDFMAEYIDLGHMSIVNERDVSSRLSKEYYLPHHPVFKETSLTTKCRVVFDGSAATDTGLSLNDVLLVGQNLQDTIFSILLRFRQYPVVIGADVVKMYRQILVTPEHRNLQRILWRFSPNEKIGVYTLNTVTYGTASAAFLSIRCLKQIGIDQEKTYPQASRAILNNFYVDDLWVGASTIGEARKLKKEVTQILESYGFVLRKWISNYKEVLIDEGDTQGNIEHYLLNDNDLTKALGILWNSKVDSFTFKINVDTSQRVTKRSVLSIIGQIFDPLGLVGPAVIRAKLIMQYLWQIDAKWDEGLPQDLHTLWIKFREQIQSLQNLTISRKAICDNPYKIQLICFSDASEKAYGTVIYVRSIDKNGTISIKTLCAKSRVAPLKTVSLPRLELCAALLCARLAREVRLSIDVSIDEIIYWTDSTITLCWIKGEPHQWKSFIANRTSEIHKLTNINEWRHISSQYNPADIISRGIDPDRLEGCDLWWHGPKWVILSEDQWPISSPTGPTINSDNLERKVKQSFALTIDEDIFEKYSSFLKLIRVTAYCLRFYKNCNLDKMSRLNGHLVANELHNSLNCLIKIVQRSSFPEELKALKASRALSKSSKLLSLNVFMDSEGIIRVGGRLNNAKINYDQKHQIILPRNHSFTRLLVLYEHYKNLHVGHQTLLNIIRLKFWILSGRSTIRYILNKCLVCFRHKSHNTKQLMGQLPEARVTPSKPFTNVGVDYAGPFELRVCKFRGVIKIKSYLCIFICLATKAVHLELAIDLSTESFLNCFKRFIARRGLCANVFSDNGKNFVGAHNHLNVLYKFLQRNETQTTFLKYFSEHFINWHFIPAYAPHFGGLWESAVKSSKYHLKRVIGEMILTYDEMNTILAQVESILNSRPLTPMSEDPSDLEVLTPGHFLIGSSLLSLPQENLIFNNVKKLKRFQQRTQLLQHFWQRWSKEYLSTLQQRGKWHTATPSIQPGMLVLIKDDGLPPLKWLLGRVVDTHPGSDGKVRVVSLKTSKGIL